MTVHETTEDYLKLILVLQEKKGYARAVRPGRADALSFPVTARGYTGSALTGTRGVLKKAFLCTPFLLPSYRTFISF